MVGEESHTFFGNLLKLLFAENAIIHPDFAPQKRMILLNISALYCRRRKRAAPKHALPLFEAGGRSKHTNSYFIIIYLYDLVNRFIARRAVRRPSREKADEVKRAGLVQGLGKSGRKKPREKTGEKREKKAGGKTALIIACKKEKHRSRTLQCFS